MSRPGQTTRRADPAEQVREFAGQFGAAFSGQAVARLSARAAELGLAFTPDELRILAALDTPARVQSFLNTGLYYNNDHATPDTEETAMPPRQVLQTAQAHCFEGALFAYAVNYLHGHDPRLVLLEASQDSDHNLVLFRDPHTGRYGCNAHSRYPHLDGRPAEYTAVRAMAESYYPWYYSDRTNDPADLTLVGYSDPFDLVARFGTAWMAGDAPLWDIYYTYVDHSLAFHYLFDDSPSSHPYSLIRALQAGWIRFDPAGRPVVDTGRLPADAWSAWQAFWVAYDPGDPRPRGRARDLELEFRKRTGTTPIDLAENAEDLQYFLDAGYRVDQLLAA